MYTQAKISTAVGDGVAPTFVQNGVQESTKTDFLVVTFTKEPTTIYIIVFVRIYKAEHTAHMWISKLKEDHIHTTDPLCGPDQID